MDSSSGAEDALHAKPRTEHKGQTVIIFDWDDTLIPTHWLRRNEHRVLVEDLHAVLRKVAQHAKFVLETAMRLGCTYIVTNAEVGWVELSAARWVPELLPVLAQVPIISARDSFEHLFPANPGQWKVQAFRVLRQQLRSRGA